MVSHEIEIKLKYNNKERVLKKMNDLGAKFKEKYLLHDTYFGFTKDIGNKNKLVRIREKNKFYELTFKGEAEDKNHVWKRVEINTEIKEPNKVMEIIYNLGLVKIKENESEREIYLLKKLEIAFIDFKLPAELSVIELEGSEDEINWLVGELGDSVERVGEDFFKIFDK